MQDVLLKEQWDSSIKSYDNWCFIEKFRDRVTSLTVPNLDDPNMFGRILKIVSPVNI